jgi:hypothetical protein
MMLKIGQILTDKKKSIQSKVNAKKAVKIKPTYNIR